MSLKMSISLSPDSILSITWFLRRFGYGLPFGMIFLEKAELLKKEGLSSIIAFVEDLTGKERTPRGRWLVVDMSFASGRFSMLSTTV